MMTYWWFNEVWTKLVKPASAVLSVAAIFILAFTMAHIISQNTKVIVLYRSLGASKWQLMLIYFAYMVLLCMRAIIFAAAVGIALAGCATIVGWSYFSAQLLATYPEMPHYWPILMGVNWQCLQIILGMLGAVPFSFLLCLDQFSSKKLALKLKGD